MDEFRFGETYADVTPSLAYTYTTWSDDMAWEGADSSENGDPDGDQISNYWEYSMDLNPLVSDASPFIVSTDPAGPYFQLD